MPNLPNINNSVQYLIFFGFDLNKDSFNLNKESNIVGWKCQTQLLEIWTSKKNLAKIKQNLMQRMTSQILRIEISIVKIDPWLVKDRSLSANKAKIMV